MIESAAIADPQITRSLLSPQNFVGASQLHRLADPGFRFGQSRSEAAKFCRLEVTSLLGESQIRGSSKRVTVRKICIDRANFTRLPILDSIRG